MERIWISRVTLYISHLQAPETYYAPFENEELDVHMVVSCLWHITNKFFDEYLEFSVSILPGKCKAFDKSIELQAWMKKTYYCDLEIWLSWCSQKLLLARKQS